MSRPLMTSFTNDNYPATYARELLKPSKDS